VRAQQCHLAAAESRRDPGHGLGDNQAEDADEGGEAQREGEISGSDSDRSDIRGREQGQQDYRRARAVHEAHRCEAYAEHGGQGVGVFAPEGNSERD